MSSKSATMTIASKYGTTWPGSLEYTLVWHQTYDRFVFIVGNETTTNWVYADAFGSPPAGQWYYVVAWHNAATNEIGISVNNLVNSDCHKGGGRKARNGGTRGEAYPDLG